MTETLIGLQSNKSCKYGGKSLPLGNQWACIITWCLDVLAYPLDCLNFFHCTLVLESWPSVNYRIHGGHVLAYPASRSTIHAKFLMKQGSHTVQYVKK